MTAQKWYATFVMSREATLSERVREQLERLVLESGLSPGDRLPAERELAARFKVSRTVVREAVLALAARGMLDVRRGSGTTIITPSISSLTPPMTMLLKGKQSAIDFRKVMEVRRLLEVHIAGLAAERRTQADLEKLSGILRRREGIAQDRDLFARWDVSFHSALAESTQNELFPLLLDSVVAMMRSIRELGFTVRGTPTRALRHHRAILEEVRRGDVGRARDAMHAHLMESEQTLIKALKKQAS